MCDDIYTQQNILLVTSLFHIIFFKSIFFVWVDEPLFYERLKESMQSRFLNTNTNLGRNATLREKSHRLVCNNLYTLIWYFNSTISNTDKEMCTIERNNISSWYWSKCSIRRFKLVTKSHDKYQTCMTEKYNFWHLS